LVLIWKYANCKTIVIFANSTKK